MKNEKGATTIAAVILVIITLILVTISLYSFITKKNDFYSSLDIIDSLDTLTIIEEKIDFYLQNALYWSIIESYHNFSENSYYILDSCENCEEKIFCAINPDLEKNFENSIKENLKENFKYFSFEYMDNKDDKTKNIVFNLQKLKEYILKEKFILKCEEINCTISLDNFELSEEGYEKDKIIYLIKRNKNISITLTEEDLFLEDFRTIEKKSKECVKNNSDILSIKKCLSEEIKYFNVDVVEKNCGDENKKYYLLNLESKKLFFINNELKKIKMKFILKENT